MSGGLIRIDADGGPKKLAPLAPGSADLGVVPEEKLVLVPMMNDNKLVAYRSSNSTVTGRPSPAILPARCDRSGVTEAQEVAQEVVAPLGQHRLGVELDADHRVAPVASAMISPSSLRAVTRGSRAGSSSATISEW